MFQPDKKENSPAGFFPKEFRKCGLRFLYSLQGFGWQWPDNGSPWPLVPLPYQPMSCMELQQKKLLVFQSLLEGFLFLSSGQRPAAWIFSASNNYSAHRFRFHPSTFSLTGLQGLPASFDNVSPVLSTYFMGTLIHSVCSSLKKSIVF